MIAPERWYEYQRDYQRYGFDMKPQQEERRTRAEGRKKQRKIAVPFGNGRKAAFSVVLIAGIVMIMLIIITAYSANVRYGINKTIRENNELMGEIENLQVKIYTANNVNYIEGQAKSKLKMVSPKDKNRVYIAADDIPEQGFADMLREKAYN
ncbi:MAG: cell division protein FtsL [Bacillota bacterium]|nr:cell division protein FtsL [Bacillota bacterium]